MNDQQTQPAHRGFKRMTIKRSRIGSTLDRQKGRLLYAYGMLWMLPFRLTPARWVCDGCSGWDTMRGRWGAFVMSQFAWVRNWRYETLALPNAAITGDSPLN